MKQVLPLFIMLAWVAVAPVVWAEGLSTTVYARVYRIEYKSAVGDLKAGSAFTIEVDGRQYLNPSCDVLTAMGLFLQGEGRRPTFP
jgi:hypothetical protein